MRFQPKHFLTAPKTVFTLLLLLLCSIILSIFIPQEFSTPPAQLALWQQSHPTWLPLVKRLHLAKLFTAPWFVAILVLFLLSLTITTYDQCRIAYRKISGSDIALPRPGTASDHFEAHVSAERLRTILNQAGFRKRAASNDISRYVKHPWGYWGLALLHLGILITIIAALLLVATQKEGVLRLTEGATHTPNSPWLFEEHGFLSQHFRLPDAVRLNRVTPEFWSNGGVKSITSNLTLIAPDGRTTSLLTTTGSIQQHKNLRIYQEKSFGNNFHLLLTDITGTTGEIVLDLESPTTLAKASYGNFDFKGIPYHFKAKYYADAAGKTLTSNNPLLVVRLVANGRLIDELTLKKGEHGTLGPYDVKLTGVTAWAGFIFWQKTGMPGIFWGILIFSLGGLLYYFTIPRELSCQKREDGYRLFWKCSRFRDHYQEEYHSIRKRLQAMERP